MPAVARPSALGAFVEPKAASRHWRVALGIVLVLHGLAHSSVVTWPGEHLPVRVVAVAWVIALWGYLAAGFGLLGVPVVRRIWKPVMTAAMSASLLLLTVIGGAVAFAGALVDMLVLMLLTNWATRQAEGDKRAGMMVIPRRTHQVANGIALVALAYAAVVLLVRPITTQWGTTAAERAMPLPGDVVDARYRLDHGITINAPADSVWPWLVQLGQDRGGFYSYSWLERLVGDNVHNADRIHPEWQRLQVGDKVQATQSTYLWGMGEKLGWRVTRIEPGRALLLENWGAFLLVPVNDSVTRFLVRTRGEGGPTVATVFLGPISVFVFEPAHFIMQRGMMLGIRDRAEAMSRGH